MPKTIRKSIILCLMVVWACFFAIYAAESFGHFEDTLEHSEGSIEKSFSNPAEVVTVSSVLKHLPKIGLSTEWIDGFQLSFQTPGFRSSVCLNFLIDRSPPSATLRLFKLFSVYRI